MIAHMKIMYMEIMSKKSIFRYGNANSLGFGINSTSQLENVPPPCYEAIFHFPRGQEIFHFPRVMENYYISGERLFWQTRQLNQRLTQ